MKIGIVGTGFVGATAAYALIMQGIGRQLVLVDKNMARAEAEAEDLFHAVPFSNPLDVIAGDYLDLEGCRLVIIAAGVSQKPGETRLDLLCRNATVFRNVIPSVLDNAPDAVLVIATNPVDIMTHMAARFASDRGVSSQRVIGSGTTLDTARFRTLLGRHLGVDPTHIHGYVVGEHGDSEVLTWSLTTVGGMPIEDFCRLRGKNVDTETKEHIDQKVRNAAYNIIRGKGATYYGIGSALARIAEVILYDQRAILTVCTPLAEVAGVRDVTVSVPNLVGGNGVLATFPLPLDEKESSALATSAGLMRKTLDELYQLT